MGVTGAQAGFIKYISASGGVKQPIHKDKKHRDCDQLASDATIKALERGISAMDRKELAQGGHRPQHLSAGNEQATQI